MPPRWLPRGIRRPRKKAPEPAPAPTDDDPDRSVEVPVTTDPDAPAAEESKVSLSDAPLLLDRKPDSSRQLEDSKDERKDDMAPSFAASASPKSSSSSSSEDNVARARPKPVVESIPATSPLHAMASSKTEAYPATSGDSGPTMIPIAPGVNARLRGANETLECIAQDFFVPVVCFACTLDICCIQDADYVICPACRVVSPLDEAATSSDARELTVGLGFTFDDLLKWQAEIRSGGITQAM